MATQQVKAHDLGHGHSFIWVQVTPGDAAPEWSVTVSPDSFGDVVGIIERHGDCESLVMFRRDRMHDGPIWLVENLDPLTLSPVLHCGRCDASGFIRNGRWEPA